MSTILLPALRKPWHNLSQRAFAGLVVTGTTNTLNFDGTVANHPRLREMGLVAGDVISLSIDASSVVPEPVACRVSFYDSAGANISNFSGTGVSTTTFSRAVLENITIPANTEWVVIHGDLISNGGTSHSIRRPMINRGATAATYETPKRGATAPWTTCSFVRDNLQDAQLRNSGVSQITTFPSRRWLAQFQTIIMSGDELREWALAVDQLSDLNNVFRLVPPRYTGPSTGYAGANPAVNGGSQLGSSLICDGVSVSTAILKAGDYCSFDVTSAGGETNCQLFKIAAAATSDGSGNVTLTFTTPIRQAPADNAIVQIFSPTAQMAFVAPRGGLDLGSLRRAAVQVDAEERIWP